MTAEIKVMRGRRRRQQILKVVAACIVCLLLFRIDFIGFIWQSPHSDLVSKVKSGRYSRGGISFLREMLEEVPLEDVSCDIPYLKNRLEQKQVRQTACVRSKPPKSSCNLAQHLFGNPSSKNLDGACNHQTRKEFCNIKGTGRSLRCTCDMSPCGNGIFSLGIIDIDTGDLTWNSFDRVGDLEHAIMSILSCENSGFCYVNCGGIGDGASIQDEMFYDIEELPQLLNLPPYVKEASNNIYQGKNDLFNFNFIFIDSVSRHHFFRSLPKSLAVLESVSGDKSNVFHSNMSVLLDFEIVQGVRSRTFETLQALFSGSINPFDKPFGVLEMPRAALRTETLLKPLKKLGYKTLWLEDLCPFWEWGISKDFLVYNKEYDKNQIWKKLKIALKNASIDSIGNTFASCNILHTNGFPDPFHGPDKVCYNSRHHHEYSLDYLKSYQSTMQTLSQPFFTFLETNAGHEGTGKRIQFLDSALAEYLEFSKSLKNTLTVVFSDHGNAYGKFMRESHEGRVELYHPFLFMLIPDHVRQMIGRSSMMSLMTNQQRLVSVLDLHYTLTYLIEILDKKFKKNKNKTKKLRNDVRIDSAVSEFNKQFNVTKYGLLATISESRTCSLVPRIMPNLCLCAGYEVSVENYAFNYILALHTVGKINNEIQRQRYSALGKGGNFLGGFGRCLRMKVDNIKNIQESKNDDGHQTVKMDLYVTTPSQKHAEIFFITVNILQGSDTTRTFHVGSFERITPYSKFAVCADEGVELNVCICKTRQSDTFQNSSGNLQIPVSHNASHSKMDMNIIESFEKGFAVPNKSVDLSEAKSSINLVQKHQIKVGSGEAVTIFAASGKLGVVFEAVSTCSVSVKVILTLTTVNMMTSSPQNTVTAIMHPGDLTYLQAAAAMDTEQDWTWEMAVQHQILG